jgi:Na+/H+ antiporter NhaC
MSGRTNESLLIVAIGTALFALSGSPSGSFWPPAAALLVIIATRQALVGLLVGGLAGSVLLVGGNPLAASAAVFTDHLGPSLQSQWKLGAIAFTLILGGFAGVLEAGGGFTTLLRRLARPGRDQGRQLETAAAGLGLLCFFDGLANSMVVGRVGRDLADRSGVARVKLAYIADSTSSAVACVAIISTWIAFQLSMIGEAYALTGREANPYGVFLASMPYNFYCWFTLVMMFVAIRKRFHPGPMAAFAHEAATADPPGATIPDNVDNAKAGIASALVPLGVLLTSFFLFFVALGSPRPIWPLGRDKTVAAFGSDAGPLVLILAALAATFTAVALFPRRGSGRLRPAAVALLRGIRAMIAPVFILLAAWILGSVIDALGTAERIAGLATASGSLALLPSLVFLTGAAISFATGTSWGTMGLLFPLAVPAAATMGATDSFLPIIVGAVFSGAVFGDHCSPFSDTTIVTSISCGVEPHDHVRTQLPYAMITAAAAIILGFLPAGWGWPAPVSLALGGAALLVLPAAIKRFS